MFHRRFGHLLVVGLMTVLVLGTSASAWATQPDIVRFADQGVAEHLLDCGTFFINWEFEERGSVTTFYDDEGNPVRLKVQGVVNGQFTNATTGKTLHNEPRGTLFVDVETGTLTYVGLPLRLTISGGEPLFLDAGTITFDPTTGEVLFEAGQHPWFDRTQLAEEEVRAVLCALLADP